MPYTLQTQEGTTIYKGNSLEFAKAVQSIWFFFGFRTFIFDPSGAQVT